MKPIISLADAKAQGLVRYFTGKPCRNGHLDERHTASRCCVTCGRERVLRFEQARRIDDPQYARRRHLREQFGLTIDDVEAMMAQQGGKCLTCVRPFAKTPNVDHCHTSGKVRGLLCGDCNRALGLVRDQETVLRRMIDYLRAHDPSTPPTTV